MSYRQMTIFLLICAAQVLIGNWVGAKGFAVFGAQGAAAAAQLFTDSIPGILVLLGIVAGGVLIAHVMPWKGLPSVAYIVTLGCIVTIPGFPGAEQLTAWVSKVSFIGLCTPILAYAGLAVGKDIGVLRTQGWRIVLVGLFVFIGTFMGSAVIAELVLRGLKRHPEGGDVPPILKIRSECGCGRLPFRAFGTVGMPCERGGAAGRRPFAFGRG